ncbi:MAG: hypothetical protein ACI92Z_002405 [Paracoccaceae bacterium]|jgi:hypothetical protein
MDLCDCPTRTLRKTGARRGGRQDELDRWIEQTAEDEAQYFLDNTTIYAPEDGMIVSQQARPGLVVGDVRLGAIASFITDDKPYILGSFRQQNLKFVEPGQEVEIALDLYPGEILTGKVKTIWWATRQGQYMPSGRLPQFILPKPAGHIAVQIKVDVPEGYIFPAGGHAAVAIYTGKGQSFEFLRRIGIRIYALVTLTGDVAAVYVNIRALQEAIVIAKDNITLQKSTALLNNTKALGPGLESELQQSKNALAVLLGKHRLR